MKQKEKKSEFLKIAQSLGIAIPVSLLFATNANATPVKITSLSNVQDIVQPNNEQNSNAVIDRIKLSISTNDDGNLLAHLDAHTDKPCHNNIHTNKGSKENHTNEHLDSKKHCNTHVNNNDYGFPPKES